MDTVCSAKLHQNSVEQRLNAKHQVDGGHQEQVSEGLCCTGSRRSLEQRFIRWLSGLWRPAPYAYLDQSTAATQQQNPHPPASAFHVTEELSLDHQHFQPHPSDVDSARASTSNRQLPALDPSVLSEHAQQQPHACASAQQELQQDRSRASAHASLRRNSNSRWQRLRSWWGSQHTRDPAANRHSRGRQRPRQDSTGQREVLRNVKVVVPHLSDEVILLELERTLDANQAVENLLSRM